MRPGHTGWIINFCKGLAHEGSLLPGNYLHMECVWFVFSRFLQDQLDSILKNGILVTSGDLKTIQ